MSVQPVCKYSFPSNGISILDRGGESEEEEIACVELSTCFSSLLNSCQLNISVQYIFKENQQCKWSGYIFHCAPICAVIDELDGVKRDSQLGFFTIYQNIVNNFASFTFIVRT